MTSKEIVEDLLQRIPEGASLHIAREIEFIAAGNVYYTRQKEVTELLKAAEKARIRLEHFTINWSTNPRIVRICSVSNVKH